MAMSFRPSIVQDLRDAWSRILLIGEHQVDELFALRRKLFVFRDLTSFVHVVLYGLQHRVTFRVDSLATEGYLAH